MAADRESGLAEAAVGGGGGGADAAEEAGGGGAERAEFLGPTPEDEGLAATPTTPLEGVDLGGAPVDGVAAVAAAELEAAAAAVEVRGKRRAPSICFGFGRAAGRVEAGAGRVDAGAGCPPFASADAPAAEAEAAAAEGRTPRRFGGIVSFSFRFYLNSVFLRRVRRQLARRDLGWNSVFSEYDFESHRRCSMRRRTGVSRESGRRLT